MCQLTKSYSLKINSVLYTHQQLTVMVFHCKKKTILKVLLKCVLFFNAKQYIKIHFSLDFVTLFSFEQGARLLSRT